MKQIKGYQVRYFKGGDYSREAGVKLYSRERATRIARFLKKRYGINAFVAPMMVDASVKLAK